MIEQKPCKGIFLGQYLTEENNHKKFFWEKLTDLFYFQSYYPLVFSPDTLASWEDENPINLKCVITGKKTTISHKPFGVHKFKNVPDLLRYFNSIKYKGRYLILGNPEINKQFLLNSAVYHIHIISIDNKWPNLPNNFGFVGYQTTSLGTFLYYYVKGVYYC